MTDKQARKILHNLELRDGATIRFGVHLAGIAPARRGWARYSAAGDCIYLGDTAREIVEHVNTTSYPHYHVPLDVANEITQALTRLGRTED